MANSNYTPPIDADGTDEMSVILLNLLNQFPGLTKGQKISFATLGKTDGIAFFPSSGAAILRERKSITGHVWQACLYPFVIIYKSIPKTQAERLNIKEFLDALGKWLQKQPIQVGGESYQLSAYPECSTNRVIRSIELTQPSFIAQMEQNGTEHWEIVCRVNYENEYDT